MSSILLQDVTDAELAVLHLLWQQGASAVRPLAETLYPDRSTPAGVATVQKLLERMEDKGCVARQKGTGPQVFEATVARDDLIDRRLRVMANQLCEGSLTPLLTNLVKAGKLSNKERQELKELLAETSKPGGKPWNAPNFIGQ